MPSETSSTVLPSRLRYLAALAAVAASGCFVHSAHAETTPPPNVIVILADDIGYGEVSCYGEQRYQTPNIDALAKQGVKFTDFYAGAPECAPSRDCLMTGMHPGHARIRANFSYDGSGSQKRVGMMPEDNSVGRLMQSAGYVTACIGKWGLGEEGTDGAPWKQGFDTFLRFRQPDPRAQLLPGVHLRRAGEDRAAAQLRLRGQALHPRLVHRPGALVR